MFIGLTDFEKDALRDIVNVADHYPITLETIAKCAKALGIIAAEGKLSSYQRILFDGMISSSAYQGEE